ncbi:MAG: phospholipase D-like domain-containing protein [Alphaproteobacteria bacterium]|nr:phospholipase D-like domain-containing protein [Alphaproteobacteria bacterium]
MKTANLIRLSICFFLLSPSLSFSKTEVFFTPSLDCENKVVSLIDSSQKEILVAMYALNSERIVNALEQAYKRGVSIEILADKLQASQASSKVPFLYEKGIRLKVHTHHKTMHTKMAVFDGKIATTGSYNWTDRASTGNYEVCVFHENEAEAVQKIEHRFYEMWDENSMAKSDKWMLKKGYRRPLTLWERVLSFFC